MAAAATTSSSHSAAAAAAAERPAAPHTAETPSAGSGERVAEHAEAKADQDWRRGAGSPPAPREAL